MLVGLRIPCACASRGDLSQRQKRCDGFGMADRKTEKGEDSDLKSRIGQGLINH